MAHPSRNQYFPDYLVTPGEVLEEYLDAYGMSQAELAARTGMAEKTLHEIIKRGPPSPMTRRSSWSAHSAGPLISGAIWSASFRKIAPGLPEKSFPQAARMVEPKCRDRF